MAAACNASHGKASDWEPAAVETRPEPIRLCRKRSFATRPSGITVQRDPISTRSEDLLALLVS